MSRRRGGAVTDGGLKVRSRFEARVISDLERRGIAFEYEPYAYNWYDAARAECDDCGSRSVWKERWYTPDLRLWGDTYVEIKGKLTPDDRKTLIGVRDTHPELLIVLLFQRDNWMTTRRVRRYSDWANENEFNWFVGERVPDAWLGR